MQAFIVLLMTRQTVRLGLIEPLYCDMFEVPQYDALVTTDDEYTIAVMSTDYVCMIFRLWCTMCVSYIDSRSYILYHYE